MTVHPRSLSLMNRPKAVCFDIVLLGPISIHDPKSKVFTVELPWALAFINISVCVTIVISFTPRLLKTNT